MADRDEAGQFEPGHNLPGPGRPSLYDPAMNETARKLALLGMTDEQMAEFFGVTVQTFYNWQDQYSAFFEAVHAGKVVADAEVANSFYKRATGEFVEFQKLAKKADGSSELITLKRWEPGDPAAALNWLKNRQPEKWRDKQTVDHTHSGMVVNRIELVPLTAK